MLEEHKYYTSLLLNCYVKQGGDNLKNLIISTTFDKSILDTDTAIEVCKESKQLECALLLAQKAGNVDQQLRILIEDMKDYKAALEIIDKNMSFDNKLTYLRRFGPQLIKKLPGETYLIIEKVGEQLIQKRTADQVNATKYTQQFKWLKEIFVDNTELNKRFLDFQVTKDPNSEKEVYHGLIEWHLQDYFNAQRTDEEHKMNTGSKAKEDPLVELKKKHLIDLLINYKEKYDKKHVLMLLEMYQVSEGVQILCEMLELKHELMTYYMQNKEYENIVKLCEEYGKMEQNLWIQALTYFVTELGDDKARMDPQKYIKSVLKQLEKIPSISPLLVLEITSKNKALKFSVLKEYLGDRLKKLQMTIEKNRKIVTQLNSDLDGLKQNIKSLRTTAQLFQLKDCSECGKKLELPVLHFMCNHTFHDYCVSSSEAKARECPKCSVQAQQIVDKKTQLLTQIENHEQFFKELKDNDMKFDVVAHYFGRGLFAGVGPTIPDAAEESKD